MTRYDIRRAKQAAKYARQARMILFVEAVAYTVMFIGFYLVWVALP